MDRPKLYVYEGQPGLAPIINQLIDLVHERQMRAEDGTWTDADTLTPTEVLDIIEGRA